MQQATVVTAVRTGNKSAIAILYESSKGVSYPNLLLYLIMRDLPTAISLLAAMLWFVPQVLAEQPSELNYRFLLERFLQGDAKAEEPLRSAPEAIPLMEDYLLGREEKTIVEADINRWIGQLADDDFVVRETASQELYGQLPGCAGRLREALRTTDDLEVHWRVERLLSHLKPRSNHAVMAPQLLKNMYGRHLSTIWPEYFERFQADPKDARALLLFQYADPTFLLAITSGRIEPEVRLKYLLALKYLGIETFDLDDRLEEFRADEILDLAAKTYWPVELQPPRLDGEYYWLMRCGAVKNREAIDVLQISLHRKPTHKEIVHFNVWPRWVYLFRFENPLRNTYDGVAVAISRSEAVISRHVQTIPEGMKLATVRISRAEQFNWGVNIQYPWAKQFYPADLLDHVTFCKPAQEMRAIILTEKESK